MNAKTSDLKEIFPHSSSEFLLSLDAYIRRAAREEYELLLAEQAAAIEQADKNDQVLTVQQAAELIGIRPQTVYEWVKAGKLRAHKAGGRAVRLKKGDVLAALKVQTQPNGLRKYARRTGPGTEQ